MPSSKERVLEALARIERGDGKGQQALFERALRCKKTGEAHKSLSAAASMRSRRGAYDTGPGEVLAAPPGLLPPVG